MFTPPELAYSFMDKGTECIFDNGIETFIYRMKGYYVVPNIRIISSFSSTICFYSSFDESDRRILD